MTSTLHIYAEHTLFWITDNMLKLPSTSFTTPLPNPQNLSPGAHFSNTKPTNPEFTSPNISFIKLSHSGSLYTCPNYSRGRYQITRDNLYASKLVEIFKLANPKHVYPALFVPWPPMAQHDPFSRDL